MQTIKYLVQQKYADAVSMVGGRATPSDTARWQRGVSERSRPNVNGPLGTNGETAAFVYKKAMPFICDTQPADLNRYQSYFLKKINDDFDRRYSPLVSGGKPAMRSHRVNFDLSK